MSDDHLLELARKASFKAHSPYSGFPVGAALLSRDGAVFTGCNIENASYGLTICAERVALFKAVSEGVKDFVTLALWAEKPSWPCGACLQCLAEFAPDLRVIRLGEEGVEERALKELLPLAFHLPASSRG
ncbi:MAG: cytidine deaminase [Syntrophomonadaceae bacterium]|nr:cytidine deaminase [Syntrophomonadaceae bacterium]